MKRITDIQQDILNLKKERNICILAHAYQRHDIWEVADFIGDSFGLSVEAAKSDADTVYMCGVRFMAETVKILAPEKTVYLVNPTAGCPMAEQMDVELISALKAKNPEYAVAAYINTTAELKTVCDVCVTSSSAMKIIGNMPQDKILFIPDCNLGDYIRRQIPQKEIKLVHGGCPTHLRIRPDDVKRARAKHPGAAVLVHPECLPEVVESADFVGSTTEIMDYVQKCESEVCIIGTETSIVEHLQIECPQKLFYPLSKDCVCHNMAATTLADLYNCIIGRTGEEIILDSKTLVDARKCIDEMLRLGK